MREDKALMGLIAGIIIFAIIFFGSIWFMMWIFQNLVQIGIGLLSIVVPFLLMIIGAILIKKYLLGR